MNLRVVGVLAAMTLVSTTVLAECGEGRKPQKTYDPHASNSYNRAYMCFLSARNDCVGVGTRTYWPFSDEDKNGDQCDHESRDHHG